MTPKEQAQENKRAAAEAAAKKRLDDARAQLQAERDEHLRTMEEEAKKSKSELDKMLGELAEHERRLVRLEAYKHALRGDWDASSLQAHIDGLALRFARYMVTGHV